MRLSVYASSVKCWRHLEPVVAELRRQGAEVDTWARNGAAWGPGVPPASRHRLAPIVVVASWEDADKWPDRHVVYLEHGAGQTYQVAERRLATGFAGSDRLEHVALFLCPGEHVAERWRARYPRARVEVVGCPALDRHHERRRHERPDSTGPLVALTCHWRMGGPDLPEGMPALPHHERALPELAQRYQLLGHAHPRIAGQMERRWAELGIAYQPDPDEVLARADLLVADNTSLLYEAAAIGLPVLVLNAPWYRREVEHGLRFWSHVPGLQCDEPEQLAGAVELALADPSELSALRDRAAQHVYDARDGQAAARAAAAILDLEGVQMQGVPPRQVFEVRDHLEEVVSRLYQLGATDGTVSAISAQWDSMTPAERDRLRKMNDIRLRSEILLAEKATGDVAPPEPSLLSGELPTDDEMDEAAGQMLDTEDEGAILDALGDDAELAFRLFRLEQERPEQRVGLLEAFASVAGIDYEAPE